MFFFFFEIHHAWQRNTMKAIPMVLQHKHERRVNSVDKNDSQISSKTVEEKNKQQNITNKIIE